MAPSATARARGRSSTTMAARERIKTPGSAPPCWPRARLATGANVGNRSARVNAACDLPTGRCLITPWDEAAAHAALSSASARHSGGKRKSEDAIALLTRLAQDGCPEGEWRYQQYLGRQL